MRRFASRLIFVTLLLLLVAFAGCSPSNPNTNTDAGADAPVSTCAAPAGPGTQHKDAIAADETWKAADGPHIVTFDINVNAGATLTIEPCAEVRIQNGYSIVVEGNLVAEGTATSPIKIGADDPSTPWGDLQVFAPGTMKLAYATVSDGGGQTVNAYGVIEARGDQLQPAQQVLKVDHVTVSNSASYGVSLRAGGAFTVDSQALTIAGSKKAPMRILPRLASNIPSGTYTGNADDAIVVETESYGEVNYEDVTFHDRGVPYRIGGDTTFGDLKVGPNHFTLTLEAGVKLAFKQNGVLGAVEGSSSTGVIVANGTASQPVVFTSAAPAPAAGDWVGIQFGKVVDPGFKLDHVEIRYAGGASQSSGHHCQPNPTVSGQQSLNDDSALAIYHAPASQYLTNSLIADSAADGVDNAYTGTYFDFKPTNTFTNVAGCQVTYPLPTTGLCPNMGCP
ncbi:MAG TPA: hypothetical protein VLM85_13690 [Polyangiaceae bacterium]|nr:hypothetical protein [Polyangiaceae bacterium]